MRETNVLRRLGRARGDEGGFTLVEMTVALVVVSIVLAALATALVSGMVAANAAELRTRAVQLAAKYVEADQSVNWKYLGHRSTDLVGQNFYNGESIVRLAADVDSSTVSDIPTSGPVSVSYAGSTFQVQTYITWAGSSTTSPNDGSTYAAKRITIIVTWTPRDGTQSVTTVALRAPSAAEMAPPSTAITPLVIKSGYASPAQTLTSTGTTSTPVVITATTNQLASTVVATYQLADGTQQQLALTGDGLGTTWSGTLAAGAGPFAAGTLPITITATATWGTQVTYAATLKLTAATPPMLTLSSPSVVIGTGLPSDAVLANGSSGYVTAQPMTVSVVANTTPQSITASFPLSGGTQSTPVALSYDTSTGAYDYTFPAGTGPLAAGNLVVTFSAIPAGGGAAVTTTAAVTLTAPALGAISVSAFTNSPATAPTWPWPTATMCVTTGNPWTSKVAPVFYVMVKNVSSSDSVLVSLSNLTAGTQGPVAATYVGSSSNGMTFRATWPTVVSGAKSSSIVATVQASRAQDGTTLNPAYTSTVATSTKC